MTKEQAQKIVMDTCKAAGLNYLQATCIYAQGILESGYSSNVFKKNNNAFGMKMPKVRKSPYIIGKGTNAPTNESHAGDPFNAYASYIGLKESVLDLIHRHVVGFGLKWATIKTAEDYVNFLIKTSYFQGNKQSYLTFVATLVRGMTA